MKIVGLSLTPLIFWFEQWQLNHGNAPGTADFRASIWDGNYSSPLIVGYFVILHWNIEVNPKKKKPEAKLNIQQLYFITFLFNFKYSTNE